MASTRELKLPSKLLSPERYGAGRGDHKLHDDIIDFFQTKRLGFVAGSENSTGKEIVKALVEAFFYFQPHSKTLDSRISNFVPQYFACIFKGKVYNDLASHRHVASPLKPERIAKVSDPLYSVLLLPVLQSSRWSEFTVAVRALAENCNKYIVYLEEKEAVAQQNHSSPSLV